MDLKQLSFKSQNLTVDWISFKFENFDFDQQKQIVDYFFLLGFNSYYKEGLSFKPIKFSENYKFQLIFTENEEKYWKGTTISFSGLNALHFYKLVQQGLIDWQIFGDRIVLGRLDIYFSERIRSYKENINDFFINCQKKLQVSINNVKYEKNEQGQILKIGNRRSNRYSRIYEKSNCLRFEQELKGRLVGKYSSLLKENLQQFEDKVTKDFLLYFGKKLPLNSNYTQWLIKRVRPFRNNYRTTLQFKTDYINLSQLNSRQDEKDVVTFLKFLIFVKDLDFQKEFLGKTSYRCVFFKVSDFLEFLEPNRPRSSYQLNKLKLFINNLQKNFVIQKFSDRYFQSLVSVPQVEIFKDHNTLIAKVWVVEELFYYNYPFCFPDLFESKLTKYQLSVLFEIITKFSSASLEKQFDIKSFLVGYSKLSNNDSRIIKKHFIHYVQLLVEQKIIEKRFQIIKNGTTYETTSLNTRDISEGFIIYEILKLE